ncbi:nuclear transport factor 2 family protein [Streptomyces carpinensis]|uniref:Nuclear transport factor 2 family protein n=1 Tax=Streptomyces carpinensis TaxID=66369 RepID=A0ABV1VW49_9ACTN|nr:nuclear transport factor 2 family protein [Streptomyces carpinensis]
MTDTHEATTGTDSELEARLRRIDDQLEFYQRVSAYGRPADGNLHEETAELWAPEGVYDIDFGRFEGRDEIADFIHGSLHQGLTAKGCSHVLSLPHVMLRGDRAYASV